MEEDCKTKRNGTFAPMKSHLKRTLTGPYCDEQNMCAHSRLVSIGSL